MRDWSTLEEQVASHNAGRAALDELPKLKAENRKLRAALMTQHPSPCLICGKRFQLTDDGEFTETVYVYQRIDGKLRLATEIVLHQPLYWAHASCDNADRRPPWE